MKKTNFVLLIIIGAVFLTQPIFAQTAVEARIGVVDMNKLLQESPQFKICKRPLKKNLLPG